MKSPGEPDAANPHVRFDEGGLDGYAVQSSTLPIAVAGFAFIRGPSR
jgi:hypothetical protein